ncbi:MAG: cyclic nucleotide-binding domain-containing protein [Gammaproteobacteria bacterium]|nr:cyclic nucleotide-binding domain-containing protein [Gammaproteobacteria bacterium]
MSDQFNLAQFLSQQYLCESLTMRQVQTLINHTEFVACEEGHIITDIGDVGDALYFVIGGEVALYAEKDNKQVEVGRLVEGELIGEMSFFDHKPRTARMVAMSLDTRLLKLGREQYERLRVDHPFIAVNLLEHAIISLDHLVRRVTMDVTSFNLYMAQQEEDAGTPE